MVILDDGAHFLDTAYPARSLVVEQTTRGMKIASKTSRRFAAIARTHFKRHIEAFFLGERIVAELSLLLSELGWPVPYSRFVVVGNGALGSQVARGLVRVGARVAVWDSEFDRQWSTDTSAAVGGQPDSFDVLVGCTGEDISDRVLEMVSAQPAGHECVIVSCSSGDVEYESLLSDASVEPMSGGGLFHKGRLVVTDVVVYVGAYGRPINLARPGGESIPDCVTHITHLQRLMASELLYEVVNGQLSWSGPDCMAYESFTSWERGLLTRWAHSFDMPNPYSRYDYSSAIELVDSAGAGSGVEAAPLA